MGGMSLGSSSIGALRDESDSRHFVGEENCPPDDTLFSMNLENPSAGSPPQRRSPVSAHSQRGGSQESDASKRPMSGPRDSWNKLAEWWSKIQSIATGTKPSVHH